MAPKSSHNLNDWVINEKESVSSYLYFVLWHTNCVSKYHPCQKVFTWSAGVQECIVSVTAYAEPRAWGNRPHQCAGGKPSLVTPPRPIQAGMLLILAGMLPPKKDVFNFWLNAFKHGLGFLWQGKYTDVLGIMGVFTQSHDQTDTSLWSLHWCRESCDFQ